MARPPKSSQHHKASGNAGKRKHAETPEAPEGEVLPLPQVLKDELAQAEWDHIIGSLKQMKVARPLYRTPISLCCIVVGKILRALDEFEAGESLIVTTRSGTKLNPKFDMLYKLFGKYLSLASECGITPNSTRKLGALPGPSPDEQSTLDKFSELDD